MKQLTHILGGEERKLVFGLSGFFDHIEVAAGQPAFDYLQSFKKKEDGSEVNFTKEDMQVFLYAAINSGCDVDSKELIPFETVKRWYRCIETVELAAVNAKILSGLTNDEQGEAQSQPEQGSN